MKRTPFPVLLPDDLDAEVRTVAEVHHISLSALLRMCIKAGIGPAKKSLEALGTATSPESN